VADFVCKRLLIRYERDILVDIAFVIKEAFALVGESGSGKSLTLKALLGMLPKELSCELEVETDFDLVRGKTVSIVPQNPFTALSPLTKIGDQFFLSEEESAAFLGMVDLEAEVLKRYPSELSGGQLQRVIIAMALASKPKLLLLDEPTTALDSDTKEVILKLIKRLQREFGYKILFVTHDIESSRLLCEEIAILKKGIIVENGTLREVLEDPQTEYTRALIAANFKNRGKRA